MDLPAPANIPPASPSTSSTPSPSIREQAQEIVSRPKFHQVFTLPKNQNHDELQVSYSIAGPDVGEDVPTVLYCGGMFGMRNTLITQNWFAEQQGVRIISIDR